MKLMKLADSPQERDVRGGYTPSRVYGEVGRVKTYIKPQTVDAYANPRMWEFDQPFQVASYYKCYDWTHTNPVFLVQAAGCNLDCFYCYTGPHEVIEMSPQEIVSIYTDYLGNGGASRVFRVSGGEPTLQAEEAGHLVRAMAQCHPTVYLWLDTNLTSKQGIETALGIAISHVSPYNMAVCGCFKPTMHIDDTEYDWERLRRQAEVASFLVEHWEAAEAFFYWPCAVYAPVFQALHESKNISDDIMDIARSDVERTMSFLRETHDLLPLRTTFLRIKYGYEVLRHHPEVHKMTGDADIYWRSMKKAAMEYLIREYPQYAWLPSHMITLR